MEDEHHHHHPHNPHYGGGGGSNPNAAPPMADLRQFFSPIPTHHHFHHGLSSSSAAASAFAAPLPHHHYDAMMLVMAGGGAIHDASAPSAAMMPPAAASGGGFDMEAGGSGFGLGVGGGDSGATARWPRQETLTLLEIRSRLDHKFKEANHKGPLWDEVSRIMSEEHGYQRSGKKCREKFENLYKYYKKTKEGKAGRQDGKHYRFFRQLEALYGESSSNTHHHSNPISDQPHLNYNTPTSIPIHNTMNVNGQCSNQQEGFQSMSLSNMSSDFDTSSSEGNEIDRVGSMEINGDSSMDVMGRSTGRKRRGARRSWKAKIKEFIDSQMRKIMDRQEAWLEKMMRTLEHKEKERVLREEEWRKQEGLRVEREHKFWAKERAWIEARDKALMDALQRITGKEMVVVMDNDHDLSSERHQRPHRSHDDDDEEVKNMDHRWDESEMIKLIELRASMQGRFDECGGSTDEGDLWEEVSARMACLGHDRSAKMCKRRWDFFNKELSKKRKESSRATIDCNTKSHNTYHQQQQQQHQEQHHLQTANNLYSYGEINGQGGMGLGPPQIGLGGGNPMSDSCLRILLGDQGETHAWESYGVKLNKGDQTH